MVVSLGNSHILLRFRNTRKSDRGLFHARDIFMLLKAMINKQLTVLGMRSLLGMEDKFIGFSLLPTLNFLFTLTDTLIFMFIFPRFMLTFIQMAKRLKIKYNASNTTKRGGGL